MQWATFSLTTTAGKMVDLQALNFQRQVPQGREGKTHFVKRQVGIFGPLTVECFNCLNHGTSQTPINV